MAKYIVPGEKISGFVYTNLDEGILDDFNATGFLEDDDRRELDTELEQWRLARPRLSPDATSSTELDPATEERLRALGYLD